MSLHDPEPDDVWRFLCMISTRDNKPLLQKPSLMQNALDSLEEVIEAHESQLWGYVILPESVQFVVEVPTERTYHVLIEAYKEISETQLIADILAHHDDLHDAITYYHPVWAKPIHLIWQNGYQTQLLSSFYALSNKIADLVNKPVEHGLVSDPSAWAFSSYRSQDEDL